MDYLDLYWLPVGAGTHFQRASLVLYEALAAVLARRRRSTLCHAGLKACLGGGTFTVELTPVPAEQDVPPRMGGAVGSPFAARLRIFRYQLIVRDADALPDEQWAVGHPLRLSTEPATIQRVMDLAHTVPSHTWGRRVGRTTEMWTSNSAVAWLLLEAGISLDDAGIPDGATAPGWRAGVDAWMAEHEPVVESSAMEITRAVNPSDLAPLLNHPPRATLAFIRNGTVEALPVAFAFDAGRYFVRLPWPEPPTGRVRLLVDDGPWYFDLRGVWVRGHLVPTDRPPGAAEADAWFELQPEKITAWQYGRMREA